METRTHKLTTLDILNGILLATFLLLIFMPAGIGARAVSKLRELATERRALREWSSLTDGVAIGSVHAKDTVVEFTSYSCLSCRAAYRRIKSHLDSQADVRVVQRFLPSSGSASGTDDLAVGAACAAEQDSYSSYHDHIMNTDRRYGTLTDSLLLELKFLNIDKFVACTQSHAARTRIRRDHAVAQSLGFTSGPVYVHRGGIMRTPQALEEFLLETVR